MHAYASRQVLITNHSAYTFRSVCCCCLQLATEESKNFRDRNIFIVLVPNKAVLQKAQEPLKKKDKSEAVNEVSASI